MYNKICTDNDIIKDDTQVETDNVNNISQDEQITIFSEIIIELLLNNNNPNEIRLK